MRGLLAVGVLLCLPLPLSGQIARQGAIEGIVVDSVRSGPLARAEVRAVRLDAEPETTVVVATDARGRFRFAGLAEGRYALGIASALLDSLEAGAPIAHATVTPGQTTRVDLAVPSGKTLRAIACPGAELPTRTGALLGRVSDAEAQRPLAGAQVIVEWTTRYLLASDAHAVRTSTDGAGQYRLCGVPTDAWLMVRVEHADRVGPTLRFAVDGAVGVRVANVALSAGGARAPSDVAGAMLSGSASLVGTVRTSDGRPLAGAQVRVLHTSPVARTDEQGRFSLGGLPAGTHPLEVRRLGYRLEVVPVELRGAESTRQAVTLERVVLLDSLAVIAQRARYPEFDVHRKMAINARFLAEADIEPIRGHVNAVSDIVARIPGIFVEGQGSNAFVRGCAVAIDDVRQPDVPGVAAALGGGRRSTSHGQPGEPSGGMLNALHPSEVGAVAFYPRLSLGGPMHLRAPCAILIWRKR